MTLLGIQLLIRRTDIGITAETSVRKHADGTITYRTEELLLGKEIVRQFNAGPNVEWRGTGIAE